MVTIKEIANKLGVSISTVSKGLNGASDISAELRQQVLDTAVEMGYSTKRSRKLENRRLCLFIKNMAYSSPNEFGYDIVLGFKQNAFRHNWDVTIVPATDELQSAEKYDTYLLKNGYSGAFVIGFDLTDNWMKQIETTTMPTILFDNSVPRNPNVCTLGTDSFEGIEAAVHHLYELGHRKIAFLNGPRFSLVSEQRLSAFTETMNELHLPVERWMTVYGQYDEESAHLHVPGFLENGATAIMCGSDLIAVGVLKECHSRDLRVPDDISVIGFDDTPLAANSHPPLTTIRQERNELGKAACALLGSLVRQIPISRSMMHPRLILRKSTGPILIGGGPSIRPLR